jgi:hypothetical protein
VRRGERRKGRTKIRGQEERYEGREVQINKERRVKRQ